MESDIAEQTDVLSENKEVGQKMQALLQKLVESEYGVRKEAR